MEFGERHGQRRRGAWYYSEPGYIYISSYLIVRGGGLSEPVIQVGVNLRVNNQRMSSDIDAFIPSAVVPWNSVTLTSPIVRHSFLSS